MRIAINGLGRIGRCVVRALEEYPERWPDIELVAINGPAPTPTHQHLLSYDSVHGRFPGTVEVQGDALLINDKTIPIYHERDPKLLPWGQLGVDVLLECTGRFRTKAEAALHQQSGANAVLISAPSPDADATIVYGVNNDILRPEDKIISVGSCTTNCLAPVAKVLHDQIGIERGIMTTIHAYTADQNMVDGTHKDLRRARAAGLSMVPTSTGAAKAIGLVMPELKGKLDGISIRVPTPNVSLVDLSFEAARDTSVDDINALMKQAAEGSMQGVLAYNDLPLVSIDFNHHPASSIFDATQTNVVDSRTCRIASWYDNEWGFSCRMLDVATLLT